MTARASTHLAVHRGGGPDAPAAGRTTVSDAPLPVTISRDALRLMATLVTARLDGSAEQRRLEALDEALRAARHLSQRLADLTRHSVAEHRGSHSTWDVRAEADAAFAALGEYAHALDAIAGAFRQEPERR